MTRRGWGIGCALAVAVGTSIGVPVVEAQSVVLVRHAEKADQTADSELSAEGHARAARLAGMLGDAGVTHLFATQYRRTQQTVAPLAARLGVEVAVLHSDDIDALVSRLRALPPGSVALYAGHTGSLPKILAAFGEPSPPVIDERDYTNLYVVAIEQQDRSRAVRLRY